jgi:hypothetical protein
MGVTCELKGDWDEALKYYRLALGMPGIDDKEMATYEAAKARLTQHKDRIRRPTAKA